MQRNLKTFALLTFTLGLGACSTGVQERPYNSDPYSPEKTAGSRQAIFGANCDVQAEPVQQVPAREPVAKAEPMFKETMQK